MIRSKNQLSPSRTSVDVGLLIIRIIFGGSLLFGHGIGKWQRLWGSEEIQFSDPLGVGPVISLGLAVVAEVLAAILVILGLQTRFALIILVSMMSVIVLIVHQGDEFSNLEKPIMYGAVFVALFLTGPGKYSLDAYFKNQN